MEYSYCIFLEEEQGKLMKGILILSKYYSSNVDSSFQLLHSKEHLQEVLNDISLVIFLRYLENIEHQDAVDTIKTLYLACRLAKIERKKIKQLFPHMELPKEKPICSKIGLDEQLLRLVHNKIVKYLKFLLQDSIDGCCSSPSQRELQILTDHLTEIKDSYYSKDQSVVKCCETVYWLAEEELFQLWLKVDKQLPEIHSMQPPIFSVFYDQYSLFCTFRRKIPTIRHRQLKSVDITPQANQRVEHRLRQIAQQRQFSPFLSAQLKGMSQIVSNQIDFEDF